MMEKVRLLPGQEIGSAGSGKYAFGLRTGLSGAERRGILILRLVNVRFAKPLDVELLDCLAGDQHSVCDC